MRKFTLNPKSINSKKIISPLVLLFFLLIVTGVNAQDLADGQAAIEEAADGIEGYFDAIQTLVYIMAGIIALLGAVRTFMKWQMGDPDVMSSAAGWFGSVVFLLVSVSVVRGFFGL